MTVADINREVVSLWDEHFDSLPKPLFWPLICPPQKPNGLTVVGCNPALPKSMAQKIPIYKKEAAPGQQIKELEKHEADARKNYKKYFLPFHGLASDLRLHMEHVDLFFYRKTRQSDFLNVVFENNERLNEFGQRQIGLAIRLIELSQPKIILVANALAGRIFKKHFDLKTLDDDGLYWVTLNGHKTPVILSGMISSGRPMDEHTRERLVWHLRRTLAMTSE